MIFAFFKIQKEEEEKKEISERVTEKAEEKITEIRLGIAQSVTANTIETILLDEPTTYLDELRKQEFVNIIQDISLVPQMILITHDPELENAADNIIMVEKRNGESVIV